MCARERLRTWVCKRVRPRVCECAQVCGCVCKFDCAWAYVHKCALLWCTHTYGGYSTGQRTMSAVFPYLLCLITLRWVSPWAWSRAGGQQIPAILLGLPPHSPGILGMESCATFIYFLMIANNWEFYTMYFYHTQLHLFLTPLLSTHPQHHVLLIFYFNLTTHWLQFVLSMWLSI